MYTIKPYTTMVGRTTATRANCRVEANLDSHDIAFPVFRPGTPMHAFRISLLTAEDMETPSGRQGVARLSHVSSGKAAAVIFLLESRGGGDVMGPMHAFMKLQAE